jgi:hypothetical protein
MSLPISVTYTFATATSAIPLSQLDANFTTVVNGINGIGNGTNALANVNITGGNITGLSTAIPIASGGTGLTTTPSNGQIDIGNGTGFTRTTLTAGTNITITNGAGSITISSTSGSSGVSTISFGTTGLTPSTATSGAVTVAGTLAVANGGTGVTTSTGSGNVVLSASPTLTGTLTAATISASGNISTSGGSVSDQYSNVRDLPQNSQTSAYSLVATDDGKFINITTGGVTVPSGVFSAGQTVTIYNNSSSSQTITQGSGVTMYLVGSATTGNRTLAQRGLATVFCVASNTFVITGGGLT